ncbi:hypothetical protein J6590_064779 [Homalodisca vitripennis]|nr:hypothetical protein J6590_064779 [Homalodisca vitripennis]
MRHQVGTKDGFALQEKHLQAIISLEETVRISELDGRALCRQIEELQQLEAARNEALNSPAQRPVRNDLSN